MAVQKNFKITNGLEVSTNLILADSDLNRVGIATTNLVNTLSVDGDIGADGLNITGISTVNDLTINGRITAGSSLGISGQYLVSTGTGVTWATIPRLRTVDTQVAGIGATTFNTSYTVGLLDVYVNGVRLSEDEFTADNAATVVLDEACFGGETVEFVSYSISGVGAGFTGIQGLTILEEGIPTGNPLQVTSINFVGASVTAIGSGLGVTVYIADNDTTNPNYWEVTDVGIHTLSNVGLGTTNPRFILEVGAVGASGTTLYVNGDARITGILTVGSSSITLDGSSNTINVGTGITIQGDTGEISATSISINGETIVGGGVTSITAGSGISIDQSIGNVTITATGSVSSSQWETTDVGIHTTSNVGIGTTNPTSALTVTGDVYATGVVTATSFVGDGSGLTGVVGSGSGVSILDDGSTVGTAGTIDFGANLSVSPISAGIVTVTVVGYATEGYVDNAVVGFITSGALSGYATEGYVDSAIQPSYWSSTSAGIHTLSNVGIGTTNPTSALTVKGNTSLETLSVSGVSTFNNEVVFTRNGSVNPVDQVIINDDTEVGPFIKAGSASFYFNSPNTIIRNTFSGGRIRMDSPSGIDFEQYGLGGAYRARFDDTNVSLYSSNSLKFQTIGTGVTVTGTTFTNQLNVSGVSTFNNFVTANKSITVNGSNSEYLGFYLNRPSSGYCSLTYNYTNDVFDFSAFLAPLVINGKNYIQFTSETGVATEILAQFNYNGSVDLYYDASKKFETVGAGVTVTGTTFTNQLSVSGVSTIGSVGSATTNFVVNGWAEIDGVSINAKGDTNLNVGKRAGFKYIGGVQNVAIGYEALYNNQQSNFNTAVGLQALVNLGNTSSSNYDGNTAIGHVAGSALQTGIQNTFIGRTSGNTITSGSYNTILGTYDGNSNGLDIRTSSNNVVISDGSGNIRLYANSSGNVGFGTTNPTSKLTVRGGDISVGVSTAHGVILTSQNGTQYRLIVSDDGTLSTTAV